MLSPRKTQTQQTDLAAPNLFFARTVVQDYVNLYMHDNSGNPSKCENIAGMIDGIRKVSLYTFNNKDGFLKWERELQNMNLDIFSDFVSGGVLFLYSHINTIDPTAMTNICNGIFDGISQALTVPESREAAYIKADDLREKFRSSFAEQFNNYPRLVFYFVLRQTYINFNQNAGGANEQQM